MTVPLPTTRLPEFALRVESRAGRGDWLVLAVPAGTCDDIAANLLAELAAFETTVAVHVTDVENALALAESVRHAARDARVVVSGVDEFSDSEWEHLDLLRSRLARDQAILLLLSPDSVERLFRNAPNVSSWIGGSVWTLDESDDEESAAEKEPRLAELRRWANMTDEQLIELAQEGKLPSGPEYAEWLILIGRGDLLG